MFARLNRRGTTLPLSILVIGLLGTAVAITFARLSAERRITGDAKAEIDAFTVAQSGLSRYFSNLTQGVRPTASGNVTYNDLPNGTARVDWRLIRDTTPNLLPAVYIVTARGTNTSAKSYGPSTPIAQRSVATYALWTPAPFDLNAALTSLGPINKNGGAGEMSGIDNCGVQPNIPGVAVPGVGGVPQYTGPTGPIDGSPDNTPVQLGTPGAGGTAASQVGIDWAGITQSPISSILPHDYLYPSWPTAAQMLSWPVIRVNGDLTLPTDGNGILVVTGNVTLSGLQNWNGLILVGGSVTSNGNNHTMGAVISGLNVKLGQAVPVSQLNGNKTYEYDSCALTRALGHVGSLQRVRNGWVDTWPSY
jgi:type II secretory pathway pseudopilin PulG